MEDPDGTLASVAFCIEQLRQTSTSVQEKEYSLRQLLELIETRENGLSAVGSHSQAVPVLVSLLRLGSLVIKIQAARVLRSLCTENELRMKVLLGGCIPPLLGLLRSTSPDGQIAAAQVLYAVSQGDARDHVGSKIFSTEGVVPVLWKQLEREQETERMVDELLTAALKNLSQTAEGFWQATIQSGGVGILVKFLKAGQPGTQANVCFLLARMMMEDGSVCTAVLAGNTVKLLLKLLGPGNEAAVRAEAAGALKALSMQSKDGRKEIAKYSGIPALINATIAPSKEFMQGEHAQALQENAMCALANISGGLSSVISSLGRSLESCTSPSQVADTLGALASALMIYDDEAESTKASDPHIIEQTLVKLFKPQLPFLIQERTIEALATLYGNSILSRKLRNADGKRLLVGLITMAAHEVRDELMQSLLKICDDKGSLWKALEGRDGVQLLISLLGLSSEQQQECAVALLSLLSNENDESKWAITAAGGIPPLVQILETGSPKAKEDAAIILGNLCNHSEDIRACVEGADAVPALLWLLKNGSSNGKQIAARTLHHLIHKSDTSTISQLVALLTSDLPESKIHVLDALKNMLAMVPLNDVLREGSASNDAIETIVKLLSSSKEEIQAKSASTLAEIFHLRKDLRESSIAVKILCSVMKLLNSDSEQILVATSYCLAAIFLSVREHPEVSAIAGDALPRLVLLANSSVLEIAEQAIYAVGNLLLDDKLSERPLPQDVILPATRVLQEGTLSGKTHAAAAVGHFLHQHAIDDAVSECVNRAGTVLSLISFLEIANNGSLGTSEALDALTCLSNSGVSGGKIGPAWAVVLESPKQIIPIVSCIAVATTALQDKAIVILSRLCHDQLVVLGEIICSTSGCIASISRRVTSSKDKNVKIGGAALLSCAARASHRRLVEELNGSNMCVNLIQALVEVLTSSLSSSDSNENIEEEGVSIYMHWATEDASNNRAALRTRVMCGTDIVVWLLSVLASLGEKSKLVIMETGAVELIMEKISLHTQVNSAS